MLVLSEGCRQSICAAAFRPSGREAGHVLIAATPQKLETRMKKLTFQQKLWIPLICSLLCITIIFVYNALEIRKIRIEERSADLANAADLGLGAVKMFGDLAASGALSTPEAQKQALAVINSMRFGATGYLSIIGFDSSVVMNPGAPQTNGKNMFDSRMPTALICTATLPLWARAMRARALSTITSPVPA